MFLICNVGFYIGNIQVRVSWIQYIHVDQTNTEIEIRLCIAQVSEAPNNSSIDGD